MAVLAMNPNGTTPLAGEITLATDEPVRLTLLVSSAAHDFTVAFPDYATEHALPLLGLRPDHIYDVKVLATDRDGHTTFVPGILEARTPGLPDDMPAWRVLESRPDLMEPGYTLLDPVNEAGTLHPIDRKYSLILDGQGNLVWYGELVDHRHGLHLMPTKQLTDEFSGLYDGMLFGRPGNIFDMLGKAHLDLRDPFYAALRATDGVYGLGDLTTFHHEAYITEAGTLLTFGQVVIPSADYPTGPDDPSPAPAYLEDNPLIEYDLSGQILNVWRLSELIDTSRAGYLGFQIKDDSKDSGIAQAFDWNHANSVVVDPEDGDFIVSVRAQDAIIKFSREGELAWILGDHANWAPEFQDYLLEPVGDLAWQYGQHAATLTSDGGLLVFDNGTYRSSPFDGRTPMTDEESYSRLVKYMVDEDRMQVRQVWEFSADEDPWIFAPAYGDVDELPTTGNVLGTFGLTRYIDGEWVRDDFGVGRIARIIEVTGDAAAQPVFDLEILASVYRSERIPGLYASDVEMGELEDSPFAVGTYGADFMRSAGQRQVWGLGGDDHIETKRHDDIIMAGAGDDLVSAGAGHDLVQGGPGNDRLLGNQGDDRLLGGNGRDLLLGGHGDDILKGGNGADILEAWGGREIMEGGAGADRFVLTRPQNNVRIRDFDPEADRLDLAPLLDRLGHEGADPFADGLLVAYATANHNTRIDIDPARLPPGVTKIIAILEDLTPADLLGSDAILIA